MRTLFNRFSAALGADGGLMFRYLVTSAINVVNHQILLQTALRWWGWSGGVSNVFAAMTAVIPSYLLSRYWVWQVTGRSSLRGEIVPFWIIAIVGLVLSTVSAEIADRRFDEPLLVSAASLGAYFVVWIGKFLILNVLFRRSSDETEMASV